MTRRKASRSSAEIPEEILTKFKAIVTLIDAFCRRHLNEEYAEMCRRLTTELARKRSSPLKRGRAEVWACGIVRTIGWANLLDDPKSSPHMKLIDIDPEFGVANSTGQGKSIAIKRMFSIGRLNPGWTLPSRLGDNPLVWMVEVHGMLVDIRNESREWQEEAFRNGLIPYIPADREERKTKDASKTDLASAESDLFGALFGFSEKAMALLRESSLDEEQLKMAAKAITRVLENVRDEMNRTGNPNLAGPLEAGYEEVRRLVAELSSKKGPK